MDWVPWLSWDWISSYSFFLCHHPNLVLHVFAYSDDLVFLPKNDRVIYHVFPASNLLSRFGNFVKNFFASYSLDEAYLKRSFKRGHKGTARLWAFIFKHFSYCDNLIHFDADIVFTGDAVSRLISLSTEYDFIVNVALILITLIMTMWDHCLILFKHAVSFLSHLLYLLSFDFPNLSWLQLYGCNRITGFKLLDFFDQLSLEAKLNGAHFHFLPVSDFGGTDSNGSRFSTYSHLMTFQLNIK